MSKNRVFELYPFGGRQKKGLSITLYKVLKHSYIGMSIDEICDKFIENDDGVYFIRGKHYDSESVVVKVKRCQ